MPNNINILPPPPFFAAVQSNLQVRSFQLWSEGLFLLCNTHPQINLVCSPLFVSGQMKSGKEGNIVSTNPSAECQRSQVHLCKTLKTHWNSLLCFSLSCFLFFLVLLSVAVVIAATWLARTGSFFSNSCTLSLCLNFSVVCFTQKIFVLHKFLLLDYWNQVMRESEGGREKWAFIFLDIYMWGGKDINFMLM